MYNARLGVITTPDKSAYFTNALKDFIVEIQDGTRSGFNDLCETWRARRVGVVIVDDAIVYGNQELEDIIIDYIQNTKVSPIRFIFYSDTARNPDDAFYYRLVNQADVIDIIPARLTGNPSLALANKASYPSRPIEVAHWKTTDEKRFIRPKKKRFNLFGKKKRVKHQEDLIENIQESDATASINAISYTTPQLPPSNQNESIELKAKESFSLDQDRISAKATEIINEVLAEHKEQEMLENDSNEPEWEEVETEEDQEAPNSLAADVQENTSEESASENQPNAMKEEDDLKLDNKTVIFKPGAPDGALPAVRVTAQDLLPKSGTYKRPWTKYTIAVGGIRHGIGCTHLACTLGLELAGLNKKVAVLLRDKALYKRLQQAIADQEEANGPDGFRYDGCDFYYWNTQSNYKYEQHYDYLVADCGVITFNNAHSSAETDFFLHASKKVFMLSGAPWDIALVSELLSNLKSSMLKQWTFAGFGIAFETIDSMQQGFSMALNEEFKGILYVPFRPTLFIKRQHDISKYPNFFDGIVPKNELPLPPEPKKHAKRV